MSRGTRRNRISVVEKSQGMFRGERGSIRFPARRRLMGRTGDRMDWRYPGGRPLTPSPAAALRRLLRSSHADPRDHPIPY